MSVDRASGGGVAAAEAGDAAITAMIATRYPQFSTKVDSSWRTEFLANGEMACRIQLAATPLVRSA